MKKVFICILIILSIVVSSGVTSFAYDADKHDEYLEMVLFGESEHLLNKNEKKMLEALEYASYIAIDQFNGYGTEKLKDLNSILKGKSVIKDISEIDFTSNADHRSYTHRGWNYEYGYDKAKWYLRKELMLKTTNKVFKFKKTRKKGLSYSKECESMAKLIYYVHILGDYEERNNYKKDSLMISFVSHDEENNIIDELLNCSKVLFKDQTDSNKYISFESKLKKIKTKALKLEYSKGGVNTDEKFTKYKGYVSETLGLLIDYYPGFFSKESYFTGTFKSIAE